MVWKGKSNIAVQGSEAQALIHRTLASFPVSAPEMAPAPIPIGQENTKNIELLSLHSCKARNRIHMVGLPPS